MDDLIEMRHGFSATSPSIKGTRVRVSDIAQMYALEITAMGVLEAASGESEAEIVERIQQSLPHLTAAQIEAALAYWRRHKQEIEQEIADEMSLLKKLPTR